MIYKSPYDKQKTQEKLHCFWCWMKNDGKTFALFHTFSFRKLEIKLP